MSWVTINKDKCNDCGLCLLRCADCFARRDGAIRTNANLDTCNLCGHCVSLCPTDAIHHQMMDMNNFPKVERRTNFETDKFIKFIRERRSHRHFKNKPIAREQLETLIDVCRYAPTGSNRQGVSIKVLQDRGRIDRLSEMTVDYFRGVIQHIEQQVEKTQQEGKPLTKELEALHANVLRYKPLLESGRSRVDLIFRRAPCVLVFHASSLLCTTPKDDCVIAAQTLSTVAMTMKIESCYIGLFTGAANAHLSIIEALALPPHHQVYSTLILGYPKLKYRRAVDRKPITVSWE